MIAVSDTAALTNVTFMGPDTFVSSRPGQTPLVLDSPHSGTCYPKDFAFSCDLSVLRQAEDTHVEKLYGFASDLGVHCV